MKTRLLTRKEIADYFKVTPRTVQNWEKADLIKPFCIITNRPRYELNTIIEAIVKGDNL